MLELPPMQLKTTETMFLYANIEVVGLGQDINCQEIYVFINYVNKVYVSCMLGDSFIKFL
jgi:hypothetical protein